MAGMGPIRVETVRGEPIRVYDRILTPVARVVSAVEHRGTIREAGIEGVGWGVAHIRPLQVIEERDGVERPLLIPDVTGNVLRQMALVAVVISLVATVLIIANRLTRGRRSVS